MESKFFAELSRRLREDGISTGEEMSNRLSVLLNGRVALNVTPGGDVLLTPEASGDQEASALYHQVSRLAAGVKEYTSAMDRAPVLRACALDEPFRLLADFNGVVLAGYELEKGRGYKFATWDWDYDRKGVNRGNYFINGYEAAKTDFADRTGLAPRNRLFTDEQLAEVYRCIHEELDSACVIPERRRLLLQSALEQIEACVPDLEELVQQSNQEELELNM